MRPFKRGSSRSSFLSKNISRLGYGMCEMGKPENKPVDTVKIHEPVTGVKIGLGGFCSVFHNSIKQPNG